MNILLSLSEAIIENRQGCLGSWVEFARVGLSWFQLHWCHSTDPERLLWHCKKWTPELLSRNSLLGVVIGWAPQFLWLTNGKHPLLLIVRNLWIFLKFRRRKKCSLDFAFWMLSQLFTVTEDRGERFWSLIWLHFSPVCRSAPTWNWCLMCAVCTSISPFPPPRTFQAPCKWNPDVHFIRWGRSDQEVHICTLYMQIIFDQEVHTCR